MKTIKIIDLLNKIANGEKPPKKINVVTPLDINTNYIYIKEKHNYRSEIYTNVWLLENLHKTTLEKEVEIIEEESEEKEIEEIEKLKITDRKGETVIEGYLDQNRIDEIFGEKINELIDAYNELKRDK